MPSGPGVIQDTLIREIAMAVASRADTFLLTAETQGEDIAKQVAFCETSTVQVVQHIDPKEHLKIKARSPHVRRVQVVHVEGAEALEMIDRYEPVIDAFLLDSGRPNAAVAELGGTGRAHDWRVSAEFVRRTRKPVYLAGGLRPGNVAQAIRAVDPYGVDLCSGVRRNGQLDANLLRQYVASVRAEGSGG